ncbi:Tat pathway signal sequence domain protein [Streptomyces sp. Li-HN-5-11]|uniref:Tat pathway signal sequence domain protein n=1 Tax=Streptomyces sp. Li-HN-5-11 TaxID=3075432 RepID=UPI0028AA83BA|nr:Tat pathway signal sequence domain protein [Streptomyces sp. Li-HN-5-11]WNM31775.1 Tat pathway signal sequence domain protein [Streptomyces sp. Li-HN-5-11]
MNETPDEDFRKPYVDVDEWRDTPVRHRYVHGGFADHGTRFSIYFPPDDAYQGRFFQHITPIPGSEHRAQTARGQEDRISFAVSSGAYFLETNGGGADPGDPTVAGFRANAAAARHSRVVAQWVYGPHRVHGYAYGGSGGGYRTIAGAENTDGVWDGFVPYVIGSPMAIPNVFSVRMHAQRVLRHRLDTIVDALEPGGSNDPYQGLDAEEREALAEVTAMGFPPRAWFGHRTMGMHAFTALYGGMRLLDPGYFEDFWTLPGYLGADPWASVHRDRLRHASGISAVITAREAARLGLGVSRAADARGGVDDAFRGPAAEEGSVVVLRLAVPAPCDAQGTELIVRSGRAEGQSLVLREVRGDLALLDERNDPSTVTALRPGDRVDIDNSNFLAAQTYHRHQVPPEGFPVWDRFRDAAGKPIPPQRPQLLGPLFSLGAGGSVQTGKFSGKMIVVACLLDREAFPWQAHWYRSAVRQHLGDATDEHFRLWYVDHALHGDDEIQEDPTRSVSYLGVLHQALRDLSAWVEQGTPPAASTGCTMTDGQVVLPSSAAGRRGVQPVVRLTVDGADRADVRTGEVVTLCAVGEVPPGAGKVVAVQWDLDGDGTFPATEDVTPAERVRVERRHAFSSPGTRFVTVRVRSERDGDASALFTRVDNIARVRVVVARTDGPDAGRTS